MIEQVRYAVGKDETVDRLVALAKKEAFEEAASICRALAQCHRDLGPAHDPDGRSAKALDGGATLIEARAHRASRAAAS